MAPVWDITALADAPDPPPLITTTGLRRVISLAERAGAVGILRDDIPELGGGSVRNRRIGYDAVRWGGSVPSGMIGFNLSPRKGDFLRTLAASSQRVVLHADVQTRTYDGTLDLVTAVKSFCSDWIGGYAHCRR